MKDKPGLYVESSYWRRLVDRQDPERRRWTRLPHRRAARRFRLWVSDLVVAELNDAPSPDREQAMRLLMRSRARWVPTTRKVTQVTKEVMKAGGWSERLVADSTHLAYTTVGRMSALVTWNLDDLARPKTRRVIRDVCRGRDWPVPLIGTPKEVIAWIQDGIL